MRSRSIYILSAFLSIALLFACSEEKKPKKKKKKAKTEQPATKDYSSSSTKSTDQTDMPKENIAQAKSLIADTDAELVEGTDGKKTYKKYCSVCHGFKGDMKVNGAKDLRKTKTDLTERVAQVYFGKGLMTPFKGVLKDEEIIAVAKYVGELRK